MLTPQHALLRVCASAIFFIPYLANFGDSASLNTLGVGSPQRPYSAQSQGLTDVRGEGEGQRQENWLVPQGGLLHNSDPPPNVLSYLRLLQPSFSPPSRSGLFPPLQGNGSPPVALHELYSPAVVPGQFIGDQGTDFTGSNSALGEIGPLGLEEMRFLKAILRLARLERDDSTWRHGEALSFRHGEEDYPQDSGDNTSDDGTPSEDQRPPSSSDQGLMKDQFKPMPSARQAEQLEQLAQLQEPSEKRGLYGTLSGVRNWWSSANHQPRHRPKVDRRAPESSHYRCLKNCITEGKLHPIQCHTLC